MYVSKGLIGLSKTAIARKSTEMQLLIYYILNNIKFVGLYVSPKASPQLRTGGPGFEARLAKNRHVR